MEPNPERGNSSWIDEIPDRLAAIEGAHLLRRRRVVQPAGGAHLLVDGQPLLAFCSNDYLGLASHPALAEAARQATHRYGLGSGGSPLVSGHSAANDALEHELAAFVQLPRALYFYAGYATNTGIIPALVGKGDALFSDALNHACLIDGARLSRATIVRYPHADLAALGAALAANPARRKLVISDAVFSMDGDLIDIPALLALCERHDALLLLDDAHGFGVLGPQGRGSLAQAGLTGAAAARRVLYMATLGKAAGVAGAFVAGDATLIEWLLQGTRSYIFATAAPPLLASALRQSLRLMAAADDRRAQLDALIAQLREGLAALPQHLGWRLLPSQTPVQALVVGRSEDALALMDGLRARGLWVPAIRPPTVPAGTARLRIALSAAHTAHDVQQLLDALHAAASDPAL
ncbi:8-amino-7-oxononanoate synthase [Verminephrobacter aporrectodeae subsp. tuberculatae]|uniref:8-amino-7-oxononanoate synthase n=1 Tax=Verminephrobacter aporrectodeae subsp. tuberculatae TaxID=1110392 RepID=A0ABT3KN63_9BURK|nr:8-amino-7-oxononanoate synthase [Verminephrobacter aporrectodeae]MCW5221169.1 8-amino-7-oxononanoate synthase [Verminephrobacter aporrectodeae subsp. tuberculatae]MCW5254921.1 8-amino-7-oxononanoate synthase [Verminephrobacter aporrectodeae subsp. tuberculatae]MCW5290460.1 8-amino-7-oxononanoate synthase [Verminephrobacter aporrectodeae subsp. tuberculatae]MCW5319761.1 8-amino-7-oxononanoate synthase [Verminephrobacter aporrectodeae subsp. tuberculatae]MCW8165535.1 8-amino-7-oxononanoate sy